MPGPGDDHLSAGSRVMDLHTRPTRVQDNETLNIFCLRVLLTLECESRRIRI